MYAWHADVPGTDRLLGRTQAELADAMTWLAWYAPGIYTAVMDCMNEYSNLCYLEVIINIVSMSETQSSDDLLAEARRALLKAEQAADSGAASRAARELCAAFRVLDDTMSADGELPAAWRSKFWTVIGVWRDDEPIPLGAINGRHMLDGQDEECPDDLWAELAEADDESRAETAAVAKMRYSDS